MRHVFDLGTLRLDADAGVLTQGGAPVALGARGVAVLAALVTRAGEYLPKAVIMEAAWPGLVVEEGNLAVQISAIRRVLARVPGGDGWIETLARRGYRYAGPVVAVADRMQTASALADRTRTNLPQALTSFVGREREVAEIKQQLPTTRLLTITGTGGIGKTRLASQAAAEVLDAYRDGVWFVDLASLLNPELVPGALAQVLGVKESAHQPLLKSLRDYLRSKELLILLDNCEHLLGASADLVDTLLRETANVTVVATSREPLRVGQERTYALGALPLPDRKADTARIARSDAVRLFVDRARQHRPKFDLDGPRAGAVAAICIRLDGLPLALELAAARIAVLPVEEIGRLLDQRFRLLTRGSGGEVPRQQTLRAMLDWSYDLLEEAEKHVFARLAVFAGGWTVAAAEAIGAGEPIAKADVAYLLIALIDKSLVVVDESGDRYRMLETVRAYALARIEGGALDGARLRHATFFVALVSEWRLVWQDQRAASDWFGRMDTDHDNVLEAHTECGDYEELAEMGLDLVSGASQYWANKGMLTLAWQLLTEALARSGANRPGLPRCRALCELGAIALFLGRYDEGEHACSAALTIAHTLGDESWVAYVLRNEVAILNARGKLDKARLRVREYLDVAGRVGGRHLTNARRVQAELLRREGNLASADKLTLEMLEEARAAANPRGIAICLINLGFSAVQRADAQMLRTLLVELLETQVVSRDPRDTVCALELCASLAALVGAPNLVARFHRVAATHASRFKYRLEPVDAMAIQAVLAPLCLASGELIEGLPAHALEDVPAVLQYAQDWLMSMSQ